MNCRKCKAEIPDDSRYCNVCGTLQAPPPHKKKSRGNGQGTVYKLPNGKYRATVTLYYYVVDDKLHRKTASATFARRVDAVNALPTLRENGSKTDITLKELHELYLTTKKYEALSKSQQNKLGYAWNRLLPLHSKKLSELSVEAMQNTINEATKTFYPAREMKVMLSHLYELAKKREYCTYNKTENIELPELKKTTKEIFNDLEIEKLWQDYEGKNGEPHLFTGYILIMIYTGLRYGELSKITLDNIHTQERYMVGGIKTEAGIDRTVPLCIKIVPVVAELTKGKKKKLLEIGEDKFYANYWGTIQRLNLRPLNPHCCRHTYFTRLTSAGAPTALIAEAGGHSDYNITFQNYVHTPLSDLLSVVDKL